MSLSVAFAVVHAALLAFAAACSPAALR